MKNISISLRLTLTFSAIFLCGFLIFGVVMWADLAYHLSKGRDRTLSRRAARLVELLDTTSGDSADRRDVKYWEFAEATPEGNLIHLLDASGKRILPQNPSPPDFPWPPLSGALPDAYQDVLFSGRRYRVFTRPVTVNHQLFLIRVGGQLEDNRNLMMRFSTGLGMAIPAMLALSALGGYFLSRRVLRPVDQITATLRSISIGNLSRRLPVSPSRDELRRLAETCNEMLSRLESAVGRINRFTADASHELRSPIAFIRTLAEYALRNPTIDNESKEALVEILAETSETAGLLDDMLTLARADAGYGDLVFEPLNLTELVDDVCAKARPLAEAKNQSLAIHLDSGSTCVSGDRSSLRRLVWTLLDNAVKYTPRDGSIKVALDANVSHAVLSVSDNGMGIPEPLVPQVFDRFFRADPSRSEVAGTGLGLAIAKWIADIHHATITVNSRESEGSVFRVAFQLAKPA